MTVSFTNLKVGTTYSRHQLAVEWGYQDYNALRRGVVTPKDDNKIILFVTRDKQQTLEQYDDRIDDERLYWEGPTDHFAEDRMAEVANTNDELHLFYRDHFKDDFIYYGRLSVENVERYLNKSSRFTFRLIDWHPQPA